MSESQRVSTIELFFDLVFVFTITQVTHLIDLVHGPLDVVRALVVLGLIWWMYAGYTWLTNDAGSDRPMRIVLIAAMAAFLVIARSIPKVFDADTLPFGIAYLAVVLLHLGAFAWRGGRGARHGILLLAPFNVGASLLVIASAWFEPRWRWLFFLAAVSLFLIATLLRREHGFSINASHYAERHGLIILIVLGESVIAIGSGASERPLDARTILATILSLLLIAAIWWSYFNGADARAEEVLVRTPHEERARLALIGYWYTHFPMIVGVIAIAAGLRALVAHAVIYEGRPFAFVIAGVITYTLGFLAFRRVLGTRAQRGRGLRDALPRRHARRDDGRDVAGPAPHRRVHPPSLERPADRARHLRRELRFLRPRPRSHESPSPVAARK